MRSGHRRPRSTAWAGRRSATRRRRRLRPRPMATHPAGCGARAPDCGAVRAMTSTRNARTIRPTRSAWPPPLRDEPRNEAERPCPGSRASTIDRVSGQKPLTGACAADGATGLELLRRHERGAAHVRRRQAQVALLGDRGCGLGLRRAAPMVARGLGAAPRAVRGDEIRTGPVHHVCRPATRIARSRTPALGVALARALVGLGHRVEDTAPATMRPEAPGGSDTAGGPVDTSPALNATIPATTYFPERLPSQYLRRWRA